MLDLAFMVGDKVKELDFFNHSIVLFTDKKCNILYANDEVCEVNQELKGYDLIHPEDKENFRQLVEAALESGESFETYFRTVENIYIKTKGVPIRKWIVFLSDLVPGIE